MNKKTIILTVVIVAVLAVLTVAGYFYWINWKKSSQALPESSAEDITDSALQGVLPSLETNPLENKPSINPVDVTNPVKNIKTNPFE